MIRKFMRNYTTEYTTEYTPFMGYIQAKQIKCRYVT